jgi:hypothetical protein
MNWAMFRLTMMWTPFQGRPRTYYWRLAAVDLIVLLAVLVWLVAPFALWKAFGHLWLLLWLVPTAVCIFLSSGHPVGFG